MRIGERTIGGDAPVYTIAELGVNHDGSIDRALDLTRAAARAGADAVKLQVFRADRLLGMGSRLAEYQARAGETDPREMLRRLELDPVEMARVVALAHELGLHAIATVFSLELVREADQIAWDAWKTASPDVVNTPLLGALVATGRPLIVSTGAADLDEVRSAAAFLAPARDRVAMLQCVSAYPTPREHASIGGLRAIARVFAGPVGYSDHTREIETGALAARHGAAVLEKHLTYSRLARGPDHAASLDEAGLRDYVRLAREGTLAFSRGEPPPDGPEIGPDAKHVLDIERDVRSVSRQSVTTTRALPEGHVLSSGDLTLKRPGTGLPPARLASVVGRCLARAVEADAMLTPADLDAPHAAPTRVGARA